MFLAQRLAWDENRYQYFARIVCGNGVFVLESSFFGLDNSELIGCDGFRYALCLSALHL